MDVLAGLIVIIESYSRKVSSVLIIGIGSCYAQQEMLMREHAVRVAGIGQWRQISTAPKWHNCIS